MASASKHTALTSVWKTQGICKLIPPLARYIAAHLSPQVIKALPLFLFSLVFGTKNDLLSRFFAGFRFPAKQGKIGTLGGCFYAGLVGDKERQN